MKAIEVKRFGKDNSVDTTILIENCIKNPPEGGFTVDEMAKRLRVLSAIEKARTENNVFISLEDADYDTLKAAAKQVKWAVLDKNIVEFVNGL